MLTISTHVQLHVDFLKSIFEVLSLSLLYLNVASNCALPPSGYLHEFFSALNLTFCSLFLDCVDFVSLRDNIITRPIIVNVIIITLRREDMCATSNFVVFV